MSKGTPSFGRHQRITHIRCRRCGRHSYHIQKKQCSACAYPRPKMRKESWKWKPVNRAKRKYLRPKHQKVKTARQGRWVKNK
ncbi:MAG: 50S ribosomal protein L37e [Candidatus Aenigmarchaeota archaeon]|nr:50S ribosomal protein L37e [Candidatus Aenigmarchaeota archaeon]